MQIEITTRHGHLSDTSREKLLAKAEKLQRFFDRLTAIEVIVDLNDESSPVVDVNASAEHKHDFQASVQSDSLWGSVDSALQKVEQQLRKYKEKVQDRHRNHELRRTEAIEPDVETEE